MVQESSAFIALYDERKKQKDGAGGGKPKIDLLGDQSKANSKLPKYTSAKHDSMRAISKRALSTAGGRINVIAKVSYKQNNSLSSKSLSATINYNLDRERGIDEQERSLFTSKLDQLDRSAAKEEIEKRFGEEIAFHKIILSSGDNHISQKQFTREVMAEWQRSMGKDFEYYAVEHRNTDYHHVHIILPGRSSNRHEDLSFNRDIIAELRENGNDYLAQDRFMDRELDRAIDLEFGRNKLDRDVEKLFHISTRDYERDQAAVGLETYREMRNAQRELGLLFQYEPDRTPRNLDQPEGHDVLLDQKYGEQSLEASAEEREVDWDRDLCNKLYEQREGEREVQNNEVDREHSRKTRRENEDGSE